MYMTGRPALAGHTYICMHIIIYATYSQRMRSAVNKFVNVYTVGSNIRERSPSRLSTVYVFINIENVAVPNGHLHFRDLRCRSGAGLTPRFLACPLEIADGAL